MRPATLAVLILAAALALAGLARAQAPGAGPSPAASPAGSPELRPPTETEWKIFADLVELWHQRYCRPDLTEQEANESRLPLHLAVCSLHQISLDRLDDVEDRACYSLHVTDQESLAIDLLDLDLGELPEEATQARYDEVHERLAREQGIPLPRLHMIEYLFFEKMR